MEPRRNHSANSITRQCVVCGRWGLVGWYQHRKGWRNGNETHYEPVDGWTNTCLSCRMERLLERVRVTLAERGDPTPSQLHQWEDDGGIAA